LTFFGSFLRQGKKEYRMSSATHLAILLEVDVVTSPLPGFLLLSFISLVPFAPNLFVFLIKCLRGAILLCYTTAPDCIRGYKHGTPTGLQYRFCEKK
jgi:hypothetical protein